MRPSVKRVQPRASDSVFSDVKYQVRPPTGRMGPPRKFSVLPVPVSTQSAASAAARQRRCSVPVLPVAHHIHGSASSAMDFTLRRYSSTLNEARTSVSSANDLDLSELDEKEDALRRTSAQSGGRRRSSVTEPGSLDPNMYGFGPESALNAHGLGKLCFSLSYNAEIEVLYVRVSDS